MVKVQFPKSESNPYWDGQIHEINPMNLARMGETDYYYMDGFDFSFQFQMMTLLRKNGDKFDKVPLDDYDAFGELVRHADLRLVPTMLLGDNVGLLPQMTVEELEQELEKSNRKGGR